MTSQARLLSSRGLVGALFAVTTVASAAAFASTDTRGKAAAFHTVAGDYLVGLHAKATVEAPTTSRTMYQNSSDTDFNMHHYSLKTDRNMHHYGLNIARNMHHYG